MTHHKGSLSNVKVKTERKKDCKTGRGGFHAVLEVLGRTTVFLKEVFNIIQTKYYVRRPQLLR